MIHSRGRGLNPLQPSLANDAVPIDGHLGVTAENVGREDFRGNLFLRGIDDLGLRHNGGDLAGAVMDVTEQEPLPASSKLWDLPQAIITPHVGGQARWRNDKITDLFCRNLVRWKEGRPLINFLADKRLGFPIRGGGYPLWGEERT